MTKQNKQIYASLMSRIATVMLINQLLLLALGFLISQAKALFTPNAIGSSTLSGVVFGMAECVVYFISFVLPVALFNKMNKNADREIYEPQESEKMPSWAFACICGMCLGAILIAAYVNHFIVNAFIDYSEFTKEHFWSFELKYDYQIVIYLIRVAIIPAVVEELLLRGTVCKNLTVYGKGTAVVASAVLFALMHTNIEQLLYTFVAGLLFGWLYVESRSIVFPILLHFLNNLIPAVGDIINQNAKPSIYNAYSIYTDIAIWVITFISLVGYLIYIFKKGRIINKLILKPDENGGEVAPLSAGERATGFFSPVMILFVLYSFIVMAYYIYLSISL